MGFINNIFFDRNCDCYRFVACYNNKTQHPAFRIDLIEFDLDFISSQLKTPPTDPQIKSEYRLDASDLRRLGIVESKNSNEFTYFLEAFSIKDLSPELKRKWENIRELLNIKCDFNTKITDPFIGEIEFPAIYIYKFGSEKGTCIINESCSNRIIDALHKNDWHISIVSDEYFFEFNENNFKDYLNSLGWFGKKEEKPFP